ncbi:PHP domain-containing protein [Desulfomonile tiedjei]|uniref:Putative metal-dependent phosphoesterase, PHP family n=1 Tax=Desulfomonile tiedjei (strain ATCC 49306 / DSM 6799 / DCB-1) TaxID=706587 RepID=I4C6B1_DESTA|nr:PHP domain-containing protein [Desulfomonile tiedjei]AFM25102.1 putative metal-dependent phosphoesterase, PHP family [Desulfomonile tiedjei DSM 6799]
MKLDLHIHTTEFSSCSTMSPDELMIAARENGLDGVCITEHNRIWTKSQAEALSNKHGLAVFRGMEVTTTGGDILVFGLEEEPDGMWTPAMLKSKVDAVGGAAIAAHPFRGFLLFGFGDLKMQVQDALDNPTFSQVHGLEVCNGLVTETENNLAREVAEAAGLIMIGGSDAHRPEAVGTCITEFHDFIANEKELVQAILSSRFSLRKIK